MSGGLGGGELGVVVAPAGVGKTWMLCAIGAGAIKEVKNFIKLKVRKKRTSSNG